MPYRLITLLFFIMLVLTVGVRCGSAAEPQGSGKMIFSHIGVITTEKKPGERFVPATRVWVTDFQNHPFHVEWLRFEPDSPVTGPVRNMPHVAYKVDKVSIARSRPVRPVLDRRECQSSVWQNEATNW